jgi:hypothetical protein
MRDRYTHVGQPEQSLRIGLDAALQARRIIDVDNPTIEGLQSLLLLSQAFFAYGLGKKAYMTFCRVPSQSQKYLNMLTDTV